MEGDGAVDDAAAKSKGTGEVNINIRCSDRSMFSVQISLESTVESFREAIAQKRDISPEQQLVYKARFLRNDHQTLQSYGLEDGETVHLTREPAPAATTNPSGGTKGSTSSPSLTKDPKKSSAMWKLNNDPEKILNRMMRNPEMQEIMSRNPEFAHILNDLDSLREVLEAQENPEIWREMMRIADIELNNIESSPGGLYLLKSMYQDFEEPLLEATNLLAGAATQGGQASNPSTNFSSGTSSEAIAGSSSPNTSPLPNPWREPPEQLYVKQLSLLHAMGFSDTQENIRALTATSGDLYEAVKRLLRNSGQ